MKIFPIIIKPSYDHGGVEYTFRKTLVNSKPDGMSWYAATVTILSSTRVKFTIYGMYDNLYGGIGNQIGEYETDIDPTITFPYIRRKAHQLAVQRRQDELDKAENKIIEKYKNEILKEFDL